MVKAEFSLELRKSNGDFIKQVEVFNTYEAAVMYIDIHPVSGDYEYSIWCIEYDEHGNETNYYPMY